MNRPTMALITGGAGLIGSHVADAALARGWRVRLLDNLSVSARPPDAFVGGCRGRFSSVRLPLYSSPPLVTPCICGIAARLEAASTPLLT